MEKHSVAKAHRRTAGYVGYDEGRRCDRGPPPRKAPTEVVLLRRGSRIRRIRRVFSTCS